VTAQNRNSGRLLKVRFAGIRANRSGGANTYSANEASQAPNTASASLNAVTSAPTASTTPATLDRLSQTT
jgi:hypothetical protein